MNKHPRQKYYVDKVVQKGIIARLAIYWASTLLFVTLPLALARTLSDSGNHFAVDVVNVWKTHWPILLTLVLALPFVLNDVLKFSNRFAGPVYRLRTELKKFKETGEPQKIQFREGDFWCDLAENVNELQFRIHELESQLEKSKSKTQPVSGIVVNQLSSVDSTGQTTG